MGAKRVVVELALAQFVLGENFKNLILYFRGVAQLGRALGSGPRSRTFKSSHSDHKNTVLI